RRNRWHRGDGRNRRVRSHRGDRGDGRHGWVRSYRSDGGHRLRVGRDGGHGRDRGDGGLRVATHQVMGYGSAGRWGGRLTGRALPELDAELEALEDAQRAELVAVWLGRAA